MEKGVHLAALWVLAAAVIAMASPAVGGDELQKKSADRSGDSPSRRRHAYAAMMYMGTPRDYEFFIATRVMMRQLSVLQVDADRVVIASDDVPALWIQAWEEEDGVKVVKVPNLNNPYGTQGRFRLTMNKLYAWSLYDYDRVVMLDSDNLFLRNADELFQCGQFCAVFIHPCYFHTGLFVLQPSKEVFSDMIHELEIGRDNPDGADQGFLISYFPDLLDRPMFHPPMNGSKLNGTYRLPLGYQMDASYFYLKLHWYIPCGPNSVITFPSAPLFKPWYWWSWPILPLGLSWHEQRRQNLGYASELPVILMEALMYVGIVVVARLARPTIVKQCYSRRSEKSNIILQILLKLAALSAIFSAYTIPFFLIPRTAHPVMGWSVYLLGTATLATVTANAFLLPTLAVLTTWIAMVGALGVMAYPWYSGGIVRALALFGYSCGCSPFVWSSLVKVMDSVQTVIDREPFYPRIGETTQSTELSKLC